MKKVLVGGTFNLLHPGHILFLKKARTLGDFLVVVVASDRTVKKEKTLLLPAKKRAELLKSLDFIDKVIIGDEKDKLKVVEKERPDIIALGYDQKGTELKNMLKERGIDCQIVRIKEHLRGWSTSKIIKKGEKIPKLF